MDAEWVSLLLIQKFQVLLLDGEATIANPNLRNQVQEATNKLRLLHQSLKVSRNADQTGRLLRAFYSAEDATDIFLARTLLLQRQKLRGYGGIVCQPFKGFWIQSLFTVQIKKFMSLIGHAGCNNNISGSSLQDGTMENTRHQGTRRTGFSYLDVGRDVVGLGDQAKELEERLICSNENNQAATELISVVGEGGSGKTTLMRIVYEKVRIKRHFKNCIWVDVSDYVFRVRDVVFEMLKQVDEILAEAEESFFEQELVSKLSEVLRKDRYLVVVDDVGAPEVLERLQNVIPKSDNGSRIVVTTSNTDVVAFASSTLQMGRLNNEESWKLFLKKVCSAEDSLSNNLDLIPFKEQLLKLCDGLPLAISLMGGMLSMVESSHSEWSRVIDDANNLDGNVLALSYQELPSWMKPCFLYMGLFPKGFEVPVRRLFQLWIAEGLVTPSCSGELGPEEVAEVYLEELINRNMIEVARWRSDGIPKTCRIPGSIYDVFSPKAAAEIGLFYIHCKSHHSSGDQPRFPVRRLASYLSIKNYPSSDWYIRSLRSYISFGAHKGGIPAGEIGKFLNKLILRRDLGLLTVLDLEGVYKPRLPKSFQKLLNLKHVGLRSTALDSLPESICDLPCLETLDVKHTSITSLPSSIWMAKNLRHLYMDWIHFDDISIQLSSDSEPLAKLQTLRGLSISEQSPILSSLFKITCLTKLALRFSLTLPEPMNNWISQLTTLQSLRLRSIKKTGERGSIKLSALSDHQKLLDLYLLGVLPRPINIKLLPPNLKILTLSMSQLRKDPMRTLGQLPYLNILRLFGDSYLGEEMTCYQGGFPQLQVLKLWKLVELEKWTVMEGAMPCLREVEIRACKRLEKLEGLKQLATLKELILTNMPSHFAKEVKENMGSNVFIRENEWKSCPLPA
ncbi:unnamed protein product [Dovyalis caffra]|uniref:NB-ARC domain-containing protein n=1 Tax=Dovyalis caffra TaxID=77055 RepID=A0AAV1RHU7_9ROSI|nr:unnamed protein product [Dovyalis caffra]